MLNNHFRQPLVVSIRLVLIAVVFLTLLPSFCLADYSCTYEFLNQPGGSVRYQLTVSITASLLDYYQSQNHRTYSYNDLPKFVTPNCLIPIADSLQSVCSGDENFANSVLMLVHQIPYEASTPQKYPIETMVQNKGDCDLFSFIAASIMKAGGLDVALLYYESASHMNVGVNLPNEPRDARSSIGYFSHNGKQYYIAECTGGNWESGWRVGECPDNVKGASARVITLENCEQSSPEGVTTSLNSSSNTSTILLAFSSSNAIPGKSTSISGSILPAHPNVYVTIYTRSEDGDWSPLGMVKTDSYGQYSYQWTPNSSGTFSFRASWSGDADHSGATSDVHTLTVAPVDEMAIFEMVDASGNELANAMIVLNYTNETLYADETGRIYVTEAPNGNCSLSVYWKGVDVGSATLNVTSGETRTISCSVYGLTVTVKNVLGIAALGGEVRIYGENEAGDISLKKMTGIDGTLRLTQLPQGSYRIDVLCAGSSNSRTVLLSNSTSEVFSGIWDYTWYMTIATIATIIIALALSLRNRKEP